jgi:hypothetical protein
LGKKKTLSWNVGIYMTLLSEIYIKQINLCSNRTNFHEQQKQVKVLDQRNILKTRQQNERLQKGLKL